MSTDLDKLYNDILYSKNTYKKGVESGNAGQKTWAQANAQKAYGQMDAAEATKLQGMNAQQLSEYIAGFKNSGTAQPTPGAAPATNTAQSYIDSLVNHKNDAAIANLGKARDNALSNLGAEKAAIQPKYYDQRNQVSAGAQQQARNFAEYMASRGSTSSGANAQASLMQNMQTQGNLGSLGRQEAQAYTDIGRRTTDVGNAYESDVVAARAGGESERMQALLNDYYQQQQRELDIAGLTGMLDGQQTLAGKSYDRGIVESDRNFNRGVTESDRNYNYQVGRDKVSDNQWTQQMEQQKTAQEWSKYVDTQQLNQWEKQFEEDKKYRGLDYAMEQAKFKASQASGGGGGGGGGSGGSGGSGQKPPSIAQLIDIWRLTGEAPEGIPGVTPGVKPYDKDAAEAAEKEANSFWGILKGVGSTILGAAAGGNKPAVSDDEISNYVK